MLNGQERELDLVLGQMAESLDISPSKYKQAVERYQAVGNWLEGGDFDGCLALPEISPQGSFRLGTIIRPLRDGKDANYDIDLVCCLPMATTATTPEALKAGVGGRLKEHADYRRMLDAEGRRCWTLEYAEQDGIGFHMDVLPAVPDDDSAKGGLIIQGIPGQYARHAVAITEKHRNTATYSWKVGGSNPAGYAAWFGDINCPMFTKVAAAQKRLLAEHQRIIYASVDDVPDALVRTPLQRAIQILKRHRDVRFLKHEWEDDKPISIIITTLAAQAYQAEGDIYSALRGIVDRLAGYRQLLETNRGNEEAPTGLIQRRDGGWYIPNPVNHEENFADRWNDTGSHRAEAFFQWLSWVQQDLSTGIRLRDRAAMKPFVESVFRYGSSNAARPAPQRTIAYPAVTITAPTKPWGNNGIR